MDPVCFPITFRERERLSLSRLPENQRAKECQKERKERRREEVWEGEKASKPEI